MPEDVYPAKLEAWEYVEAAKNSGKPYVKLTFTVDGGDYDGRKLFKNQSCQPKALWNFKRVLVRLGANPKDLEADIDPEEILPELISAECRLSVKERTFKETPEDEGRPTNEVTDVLSSYSFAR